MGIKLGIIQSYWKKESKSSCTRNPRSVAGWFKLPTFAIKAAGLIKSGLKWGRIHLVYIHYTQYPRRRKLSLQWPRSDPILYAHWFKKGAIKWCHSRDTQQACCPKPNLHVWSHLDLRVQLIGSLAFPIHSCFCVSSTAVNFNFSPPTEVKTDWLGLGPSEPIS